MTLPSVSLVAAALMLPFLVTDAEAVPAYARRHELACAQCHSAWPILNAFGRTFKENGYRLDREPPAAGTATEVVINEQLTLARVVPISMRVQGRPIVKRNTDSRVAMAVVHEVELQITDSLPDNFSYFANFEAADDDEWGAGVADFVVGWHPRAEANVVGGWGALTFADPYNTFANRRLTQDRPSPNSAGFQSGHRFRDATPFASFYGRTRGLFYSASVGTGRDDFAATDRKDYMVRGAYDLPGGVSVGAFVLNGARDLTAPVRTQDYTRSGVDVQVERAGVTANAVWYVADEESATTLVSQQNSAWYLQAFYPTKTKVPVVPLLRYESVESNDGRARTDSVAFAVIAYVRGNVNVSFDATKQTKVPAGLEKTNRVSVLFMVGI